jgi:hypothetical protein
MVDKDQDDLYVRFKTLQRQLEFIEIQVCTLIACLPTNSTSRKRMARFHTEIV